MSQCSTWKLSFGLAVAAVALTFTSTTVAFAQSDASVVVTVPAANAEPLITAKVDETKLAELPSRGNPGGRARSRPGFGRDEVRDAAGAAAVAGTGRRAEATQ